ncbi:MAG TPA: hypothetical protein VGG74_01235 [Kofleriaceae bacterium]
MRILIGVAVMAAACTGTLTSATGPGDDQGSAAPPAGPVQITVRDGNAPKAGIDVLFQNSDGSVALETTTDATGVASAPLAAGNVTVARTFSGSAARDPEIYTYVGVTAGDHLVLGDLTDDTGAPTTVNVTVPADADGTVNVVSACGTGQGTAPTVSLSVAGCPSSVKFFVTDADDDSFVLAAPYSANIDLSNGLLDGALGSTFKAANVTPDISAVQVEVDAMDGSYDLYSSGAQTIDDTDPTTIDLPDLSNIDELVVATINSSSGTQMVASRAVYAATPHTIDASANLVPYISNATYGPSAITWTESGAGTADFVVSTLAVTGNTKYTRYIIAPHSGATLSVPTLAGADASFNPSAADTIDGAVGIGTMAGGYAAARPFAFNTSDLVDGTPMNGTITLSYADNTPPTL